ncbi:MAG: hypothetical protein ACE5RN_03905 [Nitrosopumilaceae archaeon]
MSLKSSLCPFCSKPRVFIAENKQWAIHLAGHREHMIQYLVDNFQSCVLCIYPKSFSDKSSAANHIRWEHKRNELIKWAYENLEKISANQILVA